MILIKTTYAPYTHKSISKPTGCLIFHIATIIKLSVSVVPLLPEALASTFKEELAHTRLWVCVGLCGGGWRRGRFPTVCAIFKQHRTKIENINCCTFRNWLFFGEKIFCVEIVCCMNVFFFTYKMYTDKVVIILIT